MKMILAKFNQFGKNRYKPISVIPITARPNLARKIFETFISLRIKDVPW